MFICLRSRDGSTPVIGVHTVSASALVLLYYIRPLAVSMKQSVLLPKAPSIAIKLRAAVSIPISSKTEVIQFKQTQFMKNDKLLEFQMIIYDWRFFIKLNFYSL